MPSTQLPKVVAIAGYDDSILGDRPGHDIGIRSAGETDRIHMYGVEPHGMAEMKCERRRQVLVDQEARRHSLPGGRPRGGLAFA